MTVPLIRKEQLMLTELTGDVVRDVHLPIAPLSPQTARGGAGVCVSVSTWLDSDVSSDQGGLIQVRDCSTNTGVEVNL